MATLPGQDGSDHGWGSNVEIFAVTAMNVIPCDIVVYEDGRDRLEFYPLHGPSDGPVVLHVDRTELQDDVTSHMTRHFTRIRAIWPRGVVCSEPDMTIIKRAGTARMDKHMCEILVWVCAR